ncbi:MAG: hypothetical protein ABIT71_13950 [Vicinamibacteraceae bacterium]
MLGVAVLQAGLTLFVAGLVVAVVPAGTLGWSWLHGLPAAALGVAVALAGARLPVRRRATTARRAIIDDYAPEWEFDEHHTRRIAAPPDRVYAAIRTLPAGDIRFFHLLTWLRRLGRPQPPGILNAPKDEPIIDTAVRGGFVLLAEDPPREVVVGAVVIGQSRVLQPLGADAFGAIVEPGFAKATMNFLIAPDGAGGSIVTTETRVHATDPRSARRFAMYWRIIQPGSGFIRRMWLRAIERRAKEGSPS